MPAFLRTVAVPWGGTARGARRRASSSTCWTAAAPPSRSPLAVLGLIAVAGRARPWFPVAAAVVVGLTFPVGLRFGPRRAQRAQLFALLLSTGWAGSQASRPPLVVGPGRRPGARHRRHPAVGARRRRPGRTSSSACCCGGRGRVGLLTRRSRQRAEQLGRLAARLDAEREIAESTAVAEERARIARDVHDSVAHSVSVMVLQLGALRTTLEPGSRVAEVLQGVERLGRAVGRRAARAGRRLCATPRSARRARRRRWLARSN